jgi:DNA-directed RNA polymerase specialized sigma24 family protein
VTFEEFAAARLPAVLKFAAVLTGDRGLAEDVVQEVLIRANARWQVIENLARPEAYVRKMIVNEYLAWRRRSWRLVLSDASSDIEGRRDRHRSRAGDRRAAQAVHDVYVGGSRW